MERAWIELTAEGPAGLKDHVASVLIRAGSAGVVEGEVDSSMAVLTAYLPQGEPVLAALVEELTGLGFEVESAPYRDRDWAEKWKEGILPVRVSGGPDSITIKTTWHETSTKPGEIVVTIDPGMAFGTGGHPTTRMCLKAIIELKEALKLSSFLDVGSGSGILAIAARKLGASRVVAVDNDPEAVRVAAENAALNHTEIEPTGALLEEVEGLFSVVAANILSGTLKALMPALSERVSGGGYLILSGILFEEARELTDHCRAFSLIPVKSYREQGGGGDWVALVFKKETEDGNGEQGGGSRGD